MSDYGQPCRIVAYCRASHHRGRPVCSSFCWFSDQEVEVSRHLFLHATPHADESIDRLHAASAVGRPTRTPAGILSRDKPFLLSATTLYAVLPPTQCGTLMLSHACLLSRWGFWLARPGNLSAQKKGRDQPLRLMTSHNIPPLITSRASQLAIITCETPGPARLASERCRISACPSCRPLRNNNIRVLHSNSGKRPTAPNRVGRLSYQNASIVVC